MLKKEDKFIAKTLFRLRVLQSKGQEFEDFFVSVMTKADQNFQPVSKGIWKYWRSEERWI